MLIKIVIKLNTKQCTAKEKTHLCIFIKCIKKNFKKKQWACKWERMTKAIENNKLTVMRKRLLWECNLYWKFMFTDENNDKNKKNLHPLHFTPVTVFVTAEKLLSLWF